MKKIFSALIALCMVLSMTAFAELTTDAKLDITANKTEVVAGDVITFTIKTTGDSNGLAYLNGLVKFNYDPNQLTVKAITSSKMTSAVKFSTCKLTKSESLKTISLQLSANQADMEDGEKFGENIDTLKGEFEIGSFTATVKEGATGSIKFELSDDTYLTYANEAGVNEDLYITYNGAVTTKALAHAIPTITVKSGSTDPVITVDESAKTGANNGVIDVVTGTEGNYSVTVKAPIGKTPVLVVGGTNIPMTSVGGADYSYAGQVSADATIKVIYEDDTATVITYPVVYQDENCAVVFGKGTINPGDKYGIQVTDTTGASKDKEAKANVGGIFGVAFNYVNGAGKTAPNGTYKAKAFVGSEYGEEITFTK